MADYFGRAIEELADELDRAIVAGEGQLDRMRAARDALRGSSNGSAPAQRQLPAPRRVTPEVKRLKDGEVQGPAPRRVVKVDDGQPTIKPGTRSAKIVEFLKERGDCGIGLLHRELGHRAAPSSRRKPCSNISSSAAW